MRIAVLSDVHDHVWNLRTALASDPVAEADVLLFCGDLCSPFVVSLLAEGFAGRPVHVVFGNNDGDLYRITQNAGRYDNVYLHGELFAGELGGWRVAVNHYPEIASELAGTGSFDLVCFGHDHRLALESRGQALAVNPGTLLGYAPLEREDVPPTFVVCDVTPRAASVFRVDGERAVPEERAR